MSIEIDVLNGDASLSLSQTLDRRDLVWINVTTNPTAEWIAHQMTEAFPWDEAPRYLIRDRDRIYGTIVTRRLRAMGIRDQPTVSASPWQNGFAERLIGSIRRECADHIIVFGEAHLRQILRSYACYYNGIRTHRSLDKDAPIFGPVSLIHAPSLADSITNTPEFRFSVHTIPRPFPASMPKRIFGTPRSGTPPPLPKRCRPKVFSHPSDRKGQPIRD